MLKKDLIKMKYIYKKLSIRENEKKYFQLMVEDLEDSFNGLTKLDVSKALIDMEYDGIKILPLYEKRKLIIYHIIGTMLGFIDSRYDYLEREVIKYSKNDYNYDKTDKTVKEGIKLFEYRKRIIDNYYEMMDNDTMEEYNKVIENAPSYDMFDTLYKIMHQYKRMGYESEFISAYMNGYHSGRICNINSIMENYNMLFGEYQTERKQEEEDVNTVKKLSKK